MKVPRKTSTVEALCRCRLYRRRPGQHDCRACHAAWMRENRPKYRDFTPEQKMRANCRSYTHQLVKRGAIKKLPCKCGRRKVQFHHTAYPNPRAGYWVCAKCHPRRPSK